jgi:hypothetical protein
MGEQGKQIPGWVPNVGWTGPRRRAHGCPTESGSGPTKGAMGALQPLGSFCHMAACRRSSENIGKMSLLPIFNKNLPRAHMESELGMLGVHGKLVKYAIHSSRRKN